MKIATEEDIQEVKNMAMNFMEVSGYKDFSDEGSIERLITNLVTSSPDSNIIILSPSVGFIAGTRTPFLFGTCSLASEIAWWVEPEGRGTSEGLKLLQAFEYWTKNS